MTMPTNPTDTAEARDQGLMAQAGDIVSDQISNASDQLSHLGERAQETAGDIAETVKEHPYATMAIAAGLAFAVGALWKSGRSSKQSQLDALFARMPSLPNRRDINDLVSRWR